MTHLPPTSLLLLFKELDFSTSEKNLPEQQHMFRETSKETFSCSFLCDSVTKKNPCSCVFLHHRQHYASNWELRGYSKSTIVLEFSFVWQWRAKFCRKLIYPMDKDTYLHYLHKKLRWKDHILYQKPFSADCIEELF